MPFEEQNNKTSLQKNRQINQLAAHSMVQKTIDLNGWIEKPFEGLHTIAVKN